eukprot:TRINITY_DN10349_c3_g1_i1.p1 TRINITY_DN10349_c3_g1~~TRINITY_DN10349_c3_g1_i1.p1  ORF type:complete len:459 (+),score=100.74 TRINITY_DN10349_c3_g1_i1:203-1378(+)
MPSVISDGNASGSSGGGSSGGGAASAAVTVNDTANGAASTAPDGRGGSAVRCLCVVLWWNGSDHCQGGSVQNATMEERFVADPSLLLLTHAIWYQEVPLAPLVGDVEAAGSSSNPVFCSQETVAASVAGTATEQYHQEQRLAKAEKRRKLVRQQKEYARVREPLVGVALQGLRRVAAGTMSTVLLPSTSVEAESVVSLYLLGGGGSRVHRPPGVDPREALGGVIVQRIVNKPLFNEYIAPGLGTGALSSIADETSLKGGAVGSATSAGPLVGGEASTRSSERNGGPRYREDVVWHGTRLKRMDGEGASLATKLQSIAEKGFDPQRCTKGAAAEGGIWVATTPLASFGHGGDGLVAFILCLAKTHFNEWVDATCARVLQRERVLPLYSLVHA